MFNTNKEEVAMNKEELTHYIYSYMLTIHGNDRDFEESTCDDLAEMILEDFTLTATDKE